MRQITTKEKEDKDEEIRTTRQKLQKRSLDQKDRALDQGDKRLDASREDSKRKSARQVISDREKRRNKKDAAENKKRARIKDNIVKRKEKEEKFKSITKQSLSPKIDQIDDKDGTATAMQKFGSNLGRSVGGAAKGAVYGSAYLLKRSARKRAEKELQRHDDLQNRRRKIRDREDMYGKKRDAKVASILFKRDAKRSTDADAEKRGLKRPALPAAKERLALPSSTSGSALTAPTKPKTQRQTNDARIAAFKKKREQQRAAGVKMREEFLYEVEKMKKEKIKKVIDIMRGKNEVEVNPGMKESINWKDDYKPLEIETVDLIKPEPLKASNWRQEISEEDNVKKVTSINKNKRMDAKMQAFKDMKDEPYETNPKKRKDHAEKLLDRLMKVDEGAAWTKKEGKSKSGGLNEKGRKSYERENPGSDLKAPSKKVGNPRRKSFCARMKGMKKKLTSSKTANDPNSRINKSLRAWNC